MDTGPLVAFLKARDRHHAWAVETLATLRPPLLTCEVVLAEACYLLRETPGGAEAVLELVNRGVIRPSFHLAEEVAAVSALIRKYGARRMDLADACLVRMSEIHIDCFVVTLDGAFRGVYRRSGRRAIPTLQPA
ncbi:MAG TPA: PIN domain-containing protein [Vicinamibacteria bacterium]|nr:PIN domain-containing protein [Vicinamibacteria bacterium]